MKRIFLVAILIGMLVMPVEASYMRNLREIGAGIIGRAVTQTFYVYPEGSGTDGLTIPTAYTKVQDALDAASTDGDDCTLIMISPHATNYDIDTTGDPTWSANVILKGTHRSWTTLKNDHASATSILKLTGKSAVVDLNFNLGTGSGNGLIMTKGGARVYHTQFIGKDLTGAATALWLDTDSKSHMKVIDVDFLGDGGTHMTALLIDQLSRSSFERLRIHECLTAIQIVGANADSNLLRDIDIGESGIGFDIDAGNEQHFSNIIFHHNTTNIDDEVGDHRYNGMIGNFPITITPDDLNGVNVTTHADPATWGTDQQIRAAGDKPFRIVGITVEPSTSEWWRIRLKNGTTYFDDIIFEANKREASAFPSGTEFIFNKGIAITASAQSESGGDNVNIWLEVQEL